MARIKTAIIGCGKNANELHTPILLKHPEFIVTGTYDLVHDRAQKLAKVFYLNGHADCKAYESSKPTCYGRGYIVVLPTALLIRKSPPTAFVPVRTS